VTAAAASVLLTGARQHARVSQAELARRAGLPRSVVNAYERGTREPGADALLRLLRAAGVDVALEPAPPGGALDLERAGRILEQVLDLAEVLPARRRPAHLPPNPFRG
jgi:transcriptional regulator with XRE-family HTH domain